MNSTFAFDAVTDARMPLVVQGKTEPFTALPRVAYTLIGEGELFVAAGSFLGIVLEFYDEPPPDTFYADCSVFGDRVTLQ